MEILFALLLGPLIFYLLPASLQLWRPFLIIWAITGLLLAILWADSLLNPYVRSGPQDWGGAFGSFLNRFFTICWFIAGLVQGIHGAARAKGNAGYRHWPVVVIGGICACAIGAILID